MATAKFAESVDTGAQRSLLSTLCKVQLIDSQPHTNHCAPLCSIFYCVPAELASFASFTLCRDSTRHIGAYKHGPLVDCYAKYYYLFFAEGFWYIKLLHFTVVKFITICAYAYIMYVAALSYYNLIVKIWTSFTNVTLKSMALGCLFLATSGLVLLPLFL